MSNETILAQIADNPNLPMPPGLTLRILDQASRPDCRIQQIGTLISQDPTLCGKMLKLVNSTLFGLQQRVTSIERAMNLLGLKHVRSLVLGLTLPTLKFKSASSARMKSYWKGSVTTATVCHAMAVKQKWPDPDSEMVAGLLCDLGELVLQETFPDKYAAISCVLPDRLAREQCTLEAEHIGIDHAEVGAHFLRRWHLPEEVTDPIRMHHRPADAAPGNARRAYLLYFASRIAQMHWKLDRTQIMSEVVSLGKERFGFEQDQLIAFLESLHGRMTEFASLIDVDLGPTDSFAEIFVNATENLTKLAVEASLDNVRMHEEKSQIEGNLQTAKQALQKTEEQLRQAQKMEAIGRLAGGVAHDFNNLLTIIIGTTDLLRRNTSLNADAKSLIDIIRQAGERGSELTRQLLAFSRKQHMVPEVTQLNIIVNNCSTLLRRVLETNIQFETSLAQELELVRVDPTQITQVLLNLAVNSRDAMPEGGVFEIKTFNLRITDEDVAKTPDVRPGMYAVMSVRDSGCGMTDETLRKIYEPFFTTKEEGKGTGLGLATVHGIVSQSGGQITVRSEIGKGTIFHVYLPVVPPLPPAKIHDPNKTVLLEPEAKQDIGTETILLAEDEDDVRDLICRGLETYGYRVITARDGMEAFELCQKSAEPIHLLVTDLAMPRMSGPELARRLRERNPAMKVLFMSGNISSLGVSGDTMPSPFLQKPFTPNLLASKIRGVLASPASA